MSDARERGHNNGPAVEGAVITVLGAGSWGLTLSAVLAGAGAIVTVWSARQEKIDLLLARRRVEKPMPVVIPPAVQLTSDLAAAVTGAQVILLCCTAQSMRQVCQKLAPVLAQCSQRPLPVLVSAAKGIETGSYKRMSEVVSETVFAAGAASAPVCALSGPNLAFEVLSGLPTASVVACADEASARYAQERLSTKTFRVYHNTDIVGVELGGALKNIIAIAAGVVDGLKLGTNAKSALMTRGLAEMTRLAVALGARPVTLAGLAGMGDLIATCDSVLSRNYRIGLALALGDELAQAQSDIGAVAEGVTTTLAVCELSKQLGIEMPIATQVAATLNGETTPREAIMNLMKRPLVGE